MLEPALVLAVAVGIDTLILWLRRIFSEAQVICQLVTILDLEKEKAEVTVIFEHHAG